MYLLALSVSQKLKGAYKEKEAGNGPFKKIKGAIYVWNLYPF